MDSQSSALTIRLWRFGSVDKDLCLNDLGLIKYLQMTLEVIRVSFVLAVSLEYLVMALEWSAQSSGRL